MKFSSSIYLVQLEAVQCWRAISSLILSVSQKSAYPIIEWDRRLKPFMEGQNALTEGVIKTLLIGISILFAASVICAAEPPSPAPRTEKPAKSSEQDDWRWECAALGKLAEKIMTNRQAGISRATMIQEVQGKYLFEYMIIAAYDLPRYSTAEIQKKSIEEFRDRIYQECVEATRLLNNPG